MPDTTDPRTCPGHTHTITDPTPALRSDEHLCRSCVRRTMRQIQNLDADLHEVTLTITRQTATGGTNGNDGRAKKGHERPLPFNDRAATVRLEQLDLLHEWAAYIAEWNRHPFPPRRPDEPRHTFPPYRIALVLNELSNASNWIRTNEQGPECARAIAQARRALRSVTDRRVERWFAGPCNQPRQDVEIIEHDGGTLTPVIRTVACSADLYAEPGKAVIVCDGYREPRGESGCGAHHPALHRHKYVLRTLRDSVLPLDAILSVLPQLTGASPSRSTVRQWRHRGQLRPVVSLIKGDTRVRYRGADVIDLALDKAARPGPRRADASRSRVGAGRA